MRLHSCLFAIAIAMTCLLVACATTHAHEARPDEARQTKHETPTTPTTPLIFAGTIEVPGMPLDFVARFEAGADDVWHGTLSIPAQDAHELALNDVVLASGGNELRFVLRPPGADAQAAATFDLMLTDDRAKASGTMQQLGMTFEVSMHRADADVVARGASRAQTPQPPFPYRAEAVRFAHAEAGFELAGTLTLPDGDGPHPAVVLLSGSGPQDRDETLFGHKPFLVIADHLTRQGIAVLRYDDRGVGESGGNLATATTHAFVGDALSAVAFLAARPEIDAARIGLVGHSEGALVAPLAAVRAPDAVAFVVMLAGTGVPGDEVLVDQMAADLRARGAGEDAIAPVRERQRAVLEATLAAQAEGRAPEDTVEALVPLVEALVEAQLELARALDGEAAVAGQDPAQIARVAAAQLAQPWMATFLALDPAESLSQVTCPVLALWGSLDTQTTVALNRPAVEAALARAPSADVTLRELDGLNHLFQSATTGAVAEYPRIEETFSPVALQALTTWLVERIGEP